MRLPNLIMSKACGCCLYNRGSKRLLQTKQIVYSKYGNPQEVLELETKDLDCSLKSDQVLVRWLASPVNPADLNQIQGVYPIMPPLPAVAGNEGCALVEQIGRGVSTLKEGDLVIPAKAGIGTWSSHSIFKSWRLFPIDNSMDVIDASMLQVNPSTAYRMLKDFVPLNPGDLVVQNGANSAVGRYVIQMCRNFGVNSLNVVRDRPEIERLKSELKELGATEVVTEEEFAKKVRSDIGAKLSLNCVGGRSSLQLVRALRRGGCMVTYGGMSKNPVQVPTASLIFEDVALYGFWVSRWYEDVANVEERSMMYAEIANWYKNGSLRKPPYRKRSLEEYNEAVSSFGCKQVFTIE